MKKVAIITGASSGIGEELSVQLSKDGYSVAVLARRAELLEKLVTRIEKSGGQALAIPCDVTIFEDMKKAVSLVEDKLGSIDLFVANAGIGRDQRLDRFDATKAKQVYDVNVVGAMQSIAAVLPTMIARKKGHIVGIASMAAFTSFPRTYVYCASKHALVAHLDGLGLEAYKYNIDVTTICPGFIRTPLTSKNKFPMPFLMDADVAVRRMVQGIRKRKRRVIFPRRLYWCVKFLNALPFSIRRRLL